MVAGWILGLLTGPSPAGLGACGADGGFAGMRARTDASHYSTEKDEKLI